MPANILNLSGYRVLAVKETEHDYHIKAETDSPAGLCPACNSRDVVGYGRIEVLVHDLAMHGKRVGIYVDARRLRCKGCSKTFMETLPSVNPNRWMTNRLVKWIGPQSLRRTFTSIAEEVGVTEGTIRNVFSDHVNDLERSVRFETPIWMGIDEIHITGQPRAVISNLKNNTAVNLLPNRLKKTVAAYLAGLAGKEDVRYVAIDMWDQYRDAVHEVLPGATVVVDKFHVQRMGNNALDEFRRSLGRDHSSDAMRRKVAGVKKDLYLFRKRERDLSERERLLLSGWLNNIPELAEAYQLKEAYYDIYEASTKQEAGARFDDWARRVGPELRPAFAPILSAWRNWRPQILAYFDHRITNAFTESLNNLIRVMNRLGRGYSFEVLRARILFTKGSHSMAARPSFRRRDWRLPEGAVGYAIASRPGKNVASDTINYGVDINKLVELIEAGKI